MKRKFLSSLFLIVLLNLLIKPFYILGIDAEVQNQLGEEVYGNYFALLNFSFLLNILLDLGITNYNTRNISQHPHLLTKHFYKILSIRIGLFFLYTFFTLLSGFLIGLDGQEFHLLLILVFNQFLVASIQFARSNFSGLHLFKTDAFVSVLDRSILIVLCALMLWTNIMGDNIRIEWFVYAQTIAYGLSAIISVAILSNRVGKIKFQIKKAFSTAIIRRSFPYALLIFLMMMYNRIDAVMIERMLEDGDEQAGIYAQGFRILDAVNMFALLFAGLLLPIFSRLIKQHESITEMKELAFRILIALSIITAITGFWFQQEIMSLRYPSAEAVSAASFGFLILSFIPVAITYVFGTLLTANGSLKALNYMALAGVILNVLLNVVLIQEMKAVGASIATLVTQSVTALIQMVLVYRIFKVKINIALYARVIALPVLLIVAVIGLNRLELQFHILYQIALIFLLGILFSFALGLLKLSDLKQIAKKS
jgi:O-antigen/teichoic acid export membrane protein